MKKWVQVPREHVAHSDYWAKERAAFSIGIYYLVDLACRGFLPPPGGRREAQVGLPTFAVRSIRTLKQSAAPQAGRWWPAGRGLPG